MRTNYNKENNKDSNVELEKDEKVVIEQDKGINTGELDKDSKSEEINEGVTVEEQCGISVESILNALESNSSIVVDTRLTLEEEFDFLFSDGLSDAITDNFYKISDEIDDALEYDRISRMEEDLENQEEVNDISSSSEEFEEEIDLGEEDDEEKEETINISERRGIEEDSLKEEVVKPEGSIPSLKLFSKKALVGTITIIVITAGVTTGYRAMSKKNSIEGLEKQVSSLYTSSKKDDLKSSVDSTKLDKYYTKLDELGTDGDTQAIRLELDTISSYIADRGILDEINSASYDLNSNDMESKLGKVKVSSMNYATPSLTDSISATINQINEDYNYFISLRDELSLVSDYSNFSVKDYQLKINKVNHTVNKKELQDKLNSISNSIKLSEAVEDIKNQSSQKIEEAVGEATNSFSEKLSEISDNIKDIVPNVVNALKEFFSGDKSQGN